jgi:hypothetical protein
LEAASFKELYVAVVVDTGESGMFERKIGDVV